MSIDSLYSHIISQLTSEGRILKISKDLAANRSNGSMVLYVFDVIKNMNDLPPLMTVKKCEVVSTYYRNLGNKSYQTKNDYEAYQFYNLSLLYAPLRSENYALALSNRSAVFFSLKKYNECLRDIDLVLNLKIDKLKDKLVKRKDLCNEELSKKKSIENENAAFDLKDFLEIKGEKDKKYICASAKLEVLFKEELGHHVVAKEDIAVGETLACEEPYFSLLLNSQFLLSCNYCLSMNMNLYPCHTCCLVLYCSEECREKAWKEYHSVECPLMATLVHMKFTKLELLALRTVIKAKIDHTDWDSLMKTIEDTEKNINNELRGCVEVDENYVFDSKQYVAIHTLATNAEKRSMSDIFQKCVTASVFLHLLLKTNFLYEQENDKKDKEREEKILKCTAGLLLLHLMTSPTNMHGISSIMETIVGKYDDTIQLGGAPYAFHSLLNHSCNPNVVRFNELGSGKVSLIALRPIKKGMQLYDNYGAHHAVQDRGSRQSYLNCQYKFSCFCEACVDDWPLYTQLSPARNLPPRISKKVAECLNSNTLEMLQIADLDTALRIYKPLCELAEELDGYTPCVELSECQEYLKQCLGIFCGGVPHGYSKNVKWEENFMDINRKHSNVLLKCDSK